MVAFCFAILTFDVPYIIFVYLIFIGFYYLEDLVKLKIPGQHFSCQYVPLFNFIHDCGRSVSLNNLCHRRLYGI